MVCRSLWPLAVCLCTPCTCPSLTSNSAVHIHSVSHSVTHRNAETHACLAGTHTLMCVTHIHEYHCSSQTNYLPLCFSSSCVPHFFMILTAGQNIVQSPPPRNNRHPSRCTVPFRISVCVQGDMLSWYPRCHLSKNNLSTENGPCHVPDWLSDVSKHYARWSPNHVFRFQ